MSDLFNQNQNKGVQIVNIEEELRQSYLDYAMSVIVSRALPDVRDGLKPVHRRVLYAMHDMGNVFNKPYKKSARIVGDVIGKYHPHGDVAVYNTIVRMAQDFSMRYPLVDGQGNFGSVDGDAAAAMRYTEIRMSKITQELLADLEKETVDFGPNYDGSLKEPLVLPAKVPNLLISGASGIAVGMATSIPPHNLREVVDGVIKVIEEPQIDNKELLKIIKGPDFPTAGFIHGYEGIKKAYETGRGIIKVRANANIEPYKKDGREAIIVTELPYQVNKANLLEQIAGLVRDKKIEGISDIRDESDRQGMRVVLELKKGAIGGVVLNQLFKLTPLESSFSIIMLALDRGQPKVFRLKEMLTCFIEHRKEVTIRRCVFDVNKAEARAHILEGLKTAVQNIDKVIALIKKATSPEEAKKDLIKTFEFSEIQSQAILDMRLQRLTGLEREKIVEEFKKVQEEIAKLKKILANEALINEIIIDELREIREKYGDERKTKIIKKTEDITIEDMIVDEEVVVAITHAGYIKRNPISVYKSQRRGGRGVKAMGTREEDFISNIFVTTTHSYILFFTNMGKVHWLKVHNIPEASRVAKGKAIVNLLQLTGDEKVRAMLTVKEFEEGKCILMATAKGLVKKTDLMAYSRPRASGIISMKIQPDDQLIGAKLVIPGEEIFLATEKGKSIRFNEKQARSMGRASKGVKGIGLRKGDKVVGLEILRKDASLLTVTTKGYGKRTEVESYREQNRGGKGTIAIKTTTKNGEVVSIRQVADEDEIMIITSTGTMIRTKASGISKIGRNTQGVRLINIKGDERVVAMEPIIADEEDET